MREERIELSQRERERLKGLHEVERGHVKQVDAGQRLGLSTRQVRRIEQRVKEEGDRGIVHRAPGRPSNRKIVVGRRERMMAEVRRRYADFGPTLAAEKLEGQGHRVS